jgi:hypothetical protein
MTTVSNLQTPMPANLHPDPSGWRSTRQGSSARSSA